MEAEFQNWPVRLKRSWNCEQPDSTAPEPTGNPLAALS